MTYPEWMGKREQAMHALRTDPTWRPGRWSVVIGGRVQESSDDVNAFLSALSQVNAAMVSAYGEAPRPTSLEALGVQYVMMLRRIGLAT